MTIRRLILGAVALTLMFWAGYVVGTHADAQPACVDVHGSTIEAAKARLDGKEPCGGTP